MLALVEKQSDVMMRIENLQTDFLNVLDRLGLARVRPVLFQNTMAERRSDWRFYYSEAITPQALRQVGPFVRKWGHSSPEEWGESRKDWRTEIRFKARSTAQNVYVSYPRNNQSTAGNHGRTIRSVLIRSLMCISERSRNDRGRRR